MSAKRGRRSWGYVRRLPSNRLQASYLGPDGRRYYAWGTFATKMDADSWLQSERRLIERDVWSPPKLRGRERGATFIVTLADRHRREDQRTIDQVVTQELRREGFTVQRIDFVVGFASEGAAS